MVLPLAPCAKETPAKTKACSYCAASKGHDHSVPTPAAPKPLQKCCFQLDNLIGASVDKLQPVLMLALLPRITLVVPIPTNYTDLFLLPYDLFDPPLHLLHCLWLC